MNQMALSWDRLTGGTIDSGHGNGAETSLASTRELTTRSWMEASELMAARIQLALTGFLTLFYISSPAPVDRASTVTSGTALLLAILFGLSLLRWLLPYRTSARKLVMFALAAADAAVLCTLIYSYHLQYGVPLAAVLKAPTFGYFFLFIALRALGLRIHSVLATGLFLTAGWLVLTALAAAQAPPSGGFAAYVTSGSLLVGAEIDKCLVLLLTTGVLSLCVHRASMLLEQLDKVNDAAKLAEIESTKQWQFREIASKLAHEIRNPLNTIHTSTALLARKAAEAGGNVGNAALRINKSIYRCEQVISDMMEFTSAFGEDRQSTNVDQWLETTLREQAGEIPPTIRVEFHGSAGDASALLDRECMARATKHILKNAVEAVQSAKAAAAGSPGDGVEIRIATACEDDTVAISFTDTGIGIEQDKAEHVLEPLVTSKGFGVGLGLPIVKRVVEAHEGQLELASTPGAGTTVSIRLPLHRKESANCCARNN